MVNSLINRVTTEAGSGFKSNSTVPKITIRPVEPHIEISSSETNDKKLFESRPADITQKLPEAVAILHIYPHGSENYSVQGYINSVNQFNTPERGEIQNKIPTEPTWFPELLVTKPAQRPDLSLGNLAKSKGLQSKEVLYRISTFSKPHNKLRKWLKNLHDEFQKRGKQPYLVIVDYTDFEIPWEMLELSPDEGNYQYLGALYTAIRWQYVIRGDDPLPLETQPDYCSGSTIAYVTPEELKGIEQEIEILQHLNSVIYKAHQTSEFQKCLRQENNDCCLVYMSCHGGFNGDNIAYATLGSARDSQQQVMLMNLQHIRPLKLLQNSQGIVFINACNSGRVHEYSPICHHYQLGFVELFLAQGCRGVLATLGEVGQERAAEMGQAFIETFSYQTDSLPSIADWLRQMRLQAIESLSDERSPEELRRLIWTFMYVYYGNPRTVLQLRKRQG